MRSFLSEMQSRVLLEKWDAFNESMKEGWFGVLALSFSLIGLVSIITATLVNASSMILPLASAIMGAIIGAWLMRSSRKKIGDFYETLESEREKTNLIGDGHRIDQSVEENGDKLRLQRDLGFVVSPLMASVAGSIGIGDYEGAVSSACLVLDECVRYSQGDSESMGDEGLSKFIGLFNSLGVEVDEAALSLSYVGLSNHISSSLSEDEILHQATVLTDTLYNSGILKPSVKGRVDDLMNSRAMKENLRFLDSVIATEKDETDTSDGTDGDWMLDEMKKAALAPEEDEIPVLEAVTFPEDAFEYDEAESKALAEQIDDLSKKIQVNSYTFEMEATASDVIKSREKHDSPKCEGLDDSEGDESTE